MDDLIKALPGIIRASKEAEEVLEAAAKVAWRRVAGEGLRQTAIAFRLYRKTLVVAVPDATWQKQLEAMSGQLLFRLNSLLGQAVVTYIEFRVDAATVETARQNSPQETRTRGAQERLDAIKHVGADLQDTAANTIKDVHLRERFLIAAGSYLQRRDEIERTPKPTRS